MKPVRSVAIWATVFFGLVGVTSADLVDLSVDVNGTAIADTGQLTYFERYDPDSPTGTGVFEPFVRVQGNGIEEGYNTDGEVQFDTKSGIWTHSVKVSDLLVVNGNIEFLLDIDQSEGGDENEMLSLDVVKIYLADAPDLDDYVNNIDGAPGVQMIYDLGNNWVKIKNDFFGPGSGTGDMRMLIENNPAWDTSKYMYFYTKMGVNNSANDGPEEWAVLLVPEPVTLVLLAVGGLSLIRRKKAV